MQNLPNAIINVNGQILEPDKAIVSVYDRAYLYGDSLYEVVRTYGKDFYLLDAHLKRLEKSAKLCHMPLGQELQTYQKETVRTLEAFRKKTDRQSQNSDENNPDVFARIIVSRGCGKIGFAVSNVETPTLYTIIVQQVDPVTPQKFEKGLKLKVVDRLRNDPRALPPAMKSGNYLNNLLAFIEANEEGFSDALLCNSEGHLTEGTTFNLFYVKRGILVTPPLDVGILAGITREKILELAKILSIPIREVRFPKTRLYEADEIFITSSVREIYPVTQVDQIVISQGSPGPLTRALHNSYREGILRSSL